MKACQHYNSDIVCEKSDSFLIIYDMITIKW